MIKIRTSSHIKHNYYKDLFYSILKSKKCKYAFIFLMFIFALGIIFKVCPEFTNYNNINLEESYLAPSKNHIFGTNEFGKDMFYLTIIGCFNTLLFSIIVCFINLLIGTFIGIIWGISNKFELFAIVTKGIVDNIPIIFIYIFFISIIGKNYFSLLLILILFGWVNIACLIRNNIILIKHKDYNIYSKCIKTNCFKKIINNYIPTLLPIIFNYISVCVPEVISLEVTLSYLSFPIGFSTTLGTLIYSSIYENNCMMYPYLLVFPLIFLIAINLCIFVIGKTISKKAMIGGGKDA